MKSIITLALLTLSVNCIAQQNTLKNIDRPTFQHNITKLTPPQKYSKEYLHKDTSAFSSSALYLLRDPLTKKTKRTLPILGLIKQEDINSMEILKDKMADSLYGKVSKNGVIIIESIPSVKTYTIQQFLDHNNIQKKDQALAIYVDYNLLPHINDISITQGNVKTVSVEKENTGEKYISIVTNGYPGVRVPDGLDDHTH
jgi:hypothetical protein